MNYLGGTVLLPLGRSTIFVILQQYHCLSLIFVTRMFAATTQLLITNALLASQAQHAGAGFQEGSVGSCDKGNFLKTGTVSSEEGRAVETLLLSAVWDVCFCVQQTSLRARSKFSCFQTGFLLAFERKNVTCQ